MPRIVITDSPEFQDYEDLDETGRLVAVGRIWKPGTPEDNEAMIVARLFQLVDALEPTRFNAMTAANRTELLRKGVRNLARVLAHRLDSSGE